MRVRASARPPAGAGVSAVAHAVGEYADQSGDGHYVQDLAGALVHREAGRTTRGRRPLPSRTLDVKHGRQANQW